MPIGPVGLGMKEFKENNDNNEIKKTNHTMALCDSMITKPGYPDGPHPTCPPFISPNVNVRSWVKRLKRGHQL